jgi:HD-like signal output (HDOD) protein
MSVDIAARLRAAFENDPNLPVLPNQVRRILDLLADPEVSFAALSQEVEKDPALALRIIRLANSAAYGQTRDVSSLQRAVAVIGLADLSGVLAGVASVGRCERFLDDPDFKWTEFWEHCSGTAFIASSLSKRLGLSFRGAEFLAGLLHDIGYLGLAKFGTFRFRKAVTEAQERHGFLADALERRFGVSTQEAGAILAEVSGVPVKVRSAIRYHKDPALAPAEHRTLVSVLSLANELAHLAGMTFCRGTADVEVVITELPAWRWLQADFPAMGQWDVARLVFALEREFDASQGFVHDVRDAHERGTR